MCQMRDYDELLMVGNFGLLSNFFALILVYASVYSKTNYILFLSNINGVMYLHHHVDSCLMKYI